MYTLIERFIENLTIIDLKNMAISKEVDLSDDELKFSFDFIKIKKLIKESLIKYAHYL